MLKRETLKRGCEETRPREKECSTVPVNIDRRCGDWVW